MIFELALEATLILAAAFAANALLHRKSAALRHTVWTAAFAILILQAVAAVVPEGSYPLPALTVDLSFTATPDTRQSWGPAARTALDDVPNWFWYAGIFLVLARVGLSHWMLWRGVRRGDPVPAPMTWGVFRPSILLPTAGAHPAVIRHEQAHVERRDGLWQLVAQTACALFWFHPLVWLAARRAAEDRERACDDRVLSGGGWSAEDYANAMLACARTAGPAALTSTHVLERRLTALFDSKIDRSALSRRAAAAVTLGAILVAVPATLLRAQDDKVYKVADGVEPPRLLKKIDPEYTQKARDAKISGTCVLEVVVGADGKARDMKVKRSLDAGLDEKAIEAVERWEFAPGRLGGKPVAVSATIEINFKLN
jgi:TonB family protein